MEPSQKDHLVSLDPDRPIWDRFFNVAPLVVVGTREGEHYDLAPKHMATPLGWQNFFGFVCTPKHRTYRNTRETGVFTVSYPRPDQIEQVAKTATPREGDEGEPSKAGLEEVATFPAQEIDGVLMEGAYLFLECQMERTIDRLGKNSLVIGGIVAAYVHEDALRAPDREDEECLQQVPLLAYIDPGRYATVRESESFPFPNGFQEREAHPTEAGFGG